MKKKISIISAITVICLLLIQLKVLATDNITIETKTDSDMYNVGGIVKVTVNWEKQLRAADFRLTYNSTKLELLEENYNERETTVDETTGDSFTNIRVNWSAANENDKKRNVTFRFKTLTTGNATISVIDSETNRFLNENLETVEQVDYTTKGSKTIKITVLGDVDLNGIINVKDVTAIQNYISDEIELTEEALINADVCYDREINENDVKILQKYIDGRVILLPFIYGDANCDGVVNVDDVTAIQRHYSNIDDYSLSSEGFYRADVNIDGEVNEFDEMIVARKVADMVGYTRLPIKVVVDSKIKVSSIDNKKMISGFDTKNMKLSLVTPVFNSGLTVEAYKNDIEIPDDGMIGTGCKIKIDEKTAGEVPDESLAGNIGEYDVVLYGDTTGDGKINAVDALALIKDINNKIKFTSEVYRQAGRIVSSNDQNPTAVDALAIIKAANGKYEINQNK